MKTEDQNNRGKGEREVGGNWVGDRKKEEMKMGEKKVIMGRSVDNCNNGPLPYQNFQDNLLRECV